MTHIDWQNIGSAVAGISALVGALRRYVVTPVRKAVKELTQVRGDIVDLKADVQDTRATLRRHLDWHDKPVIPS